MVRCSNAGDWASGYELGHLFCDGIDVVFLGGQQVIDIFDGRKTMQESPKKGSFLRSRRSPLARRNEPSTQVEEVFDGLECIFGKIEPFQAFENVVLSKHCPITCSDNYVYGRKTLKICIRKDRNFFSRFFAEIWVAFVWTGFHGTCQIIEDIGYGSS